MKFFPSALVKPRRNPTKLHAAARIRTWIAGVLLFVSSFSSAQTSSDLKLNIIPPSPEVSALAKYGNIPVSFYTGVPQISIPIYTVKSGDIQLPISLSYHASGIRVDEEASWVGLGWTLQAGGVISRVVRGKDDLLSNYYLNANLPDFMSQKTPANSFVAGCAFPVYDRDNPQQTEVLDMSQSLGRNASAFSSTPPCDLDPAPDFEPDQFSYSFLNYSGKFMIKRDRGVVLATKEKIELNPFDSGSEVFAKWEVRTKDGFKYIFDKFETYTDFDNCINQPVKTAWYLTQIVSPKGNTVTLEYIIDNTLPTQTLGTVYEKHYFSTSCVELPPVQTLNRSNNKYSKVILHKIVFDHGEVVFNSNTERADLQNARRLTSVTISRKNSLGEVEPTPFKEYKFAYEYFNGTPLTTSPIYPSESQFMLKRLKLMSVQETHPGQPNPPPHNFTYYEGGFNNLPSKVSFARDHWGYYNGETNSTLIPEFNGIIYMLEGSQYMGYNPPSKAGARMLYWELDGAVRTPSNQHMRAFTLKSIQYPTGGRTEFTFEPHDFDEEKSNINDHSGLLMQKNLAETTSTFRHYSEDALTVKIQNVDLRNIFIPKGQTTAPVKFKITYVGKTGLRWLLNSPNLSGVKVQFAGTLADPGNTSLAKCPDFSDPPSYTCYCTTVPSWADPETYNPGVCETFQTLHLAPGIYPLRTEMSVEAQGKMGMIEISFVKTEWVDQAQNPLSTAGGLRVSEINDYDTDNRVVGTRKFSYRADEDNDGITEQRSSGRRMSRPLYLHYEYDNSVYDPGRGAVVQYDCYRFVRTSDSVFPLNGSASGSVVGYDRVEVRYGKGTGNFYGTGGRTVYEFENEPDYMFDYGLARLPGLPNFAWARNGLLKRQTNFRYEPPGQFVKVSETISDYPASQSIDVLYGIDRHLPAFSSSNCVVQLFAYPAMRTEWIQQKATTEITYDTDPTKSVSTRKEYFYDNAAHMQPTRQITTDSKGKISETKMKYPLDYTTPGPAISDLISKHIHDPVIEQITKVDNNFVAASGKKYDFNLANSTQTLPKEIYVLESAVPLTSLNESADGEIFSSYTSRAIYEKYDDKGNILQYRKSDDVTTAFLWGYNYTLPVAKVENATYDAIVSALGIDVAALQNLDGQDLLNALNTLRSNLSSKQFTTTYSYDPLVGITKVTDPNGQTLHYFYDALGRLETIKDNDQNIVKRYKYHYQNED